VKGAFIPIGGLTSGFPHQGSFGRGPWGSVWPECLRNRCLAHWTVWIPVVAAGAEQVARTRRETLSRA
jgi:hypothetical protein